MIGSRSAISHVREYISMRILFLSLGLLAFGGPSPLMPNVRDASQEQRESAATAASCELVFNRAISLNESFKNAVSAGGQRVFGQEAEKYYNTVLSKEISGCVTYASTHADAVLSKLAFDLAYSYANSADALIPRELARLYSGDPEMAKAILLSYEEGKRREMIGILESGLRKLFNGRAEDAVRMKTLTRSLLELESN
jgi:hypothetical protein